MAKFGQSTCLRKCINWIITGLNWPAKIQALSNTGTSLWHVQRHIWPSHERAVQAWTSALLRDPRVCARQVAADIFGSFQLWPHLIRSIKAFSNGCGSSSPSTWFSWGQDMLIVPLLYMDSIYYNLVCLLESTRRLLEAVTSLRACLLQMGRLPNFKPCHVLRVFRCFQFQTNPICQVFGFRTPQLYPRWKPSASSQTAASRDPEI